VLPIGKMDGAALRLRSLHIGKCDCQHGLRAHAAAARVLPELLEGHRKVAKKIVNKFPWHLESFRRLKARSIGK
jgi:hypothetical protein